MSNPTIAVIGGTGFTSWDEFRIEHEVDSNTRWGLPSAPLSVGSYSGSPCLFLPRHGPDHRIPPHRINYRANIQALADAGVRQIIAIAAVGGIRDDLAPGEIALPDQIIDYSWGRPQSFWDDEGEALHIDFTHPYSPALRSALLQAATDAEVSLVDGGTYGVTQGPRLETAAEIARLRRDGCDMVGMTSMPEAALARELDMAYVCLAVSVNWAAGIGETGIHDEIAASLEAGMTKVRTLLAATLPLLNSQTADAV